MPRAAPVLWPTRKMGASSQAFGNRTYRELETALLGGFVVIVANDPRNLPCTVLELPQVNELRFPNNICGLLSWMVKAMNTELDCTIALHGVHLQSTGNKFPCHFAADVLLDGFR